MNLRSYGLAHRPFRALPDPQAYTPLDGHEAALKSVARAYAAGDAHAVITSEPGLGKTLLGIRFLDSLPAAAPRIMVNAAPGLKPVDLFQAILFDWNLPYEGKSEQELRLAIASELLAALAREQRLALLVDEAHHLSPLLLEELRLLSNIESPHGCALFLMLLGQPRLRETLARPESAAFAQRLAVRFPLQPLTSEESRQYLQHQIQLAVGDSRRLFTEEALDLLAGHSRGIPRLLNLAAGEALTLAEGDDSVDAEAVLEALQRLGLLPDEAATVKLSEAKPRRGKPAPRRKSA